RVADEHTTGDLLLIDVARVGDDRRHPGPHVLPLDQGHLSDPDPCDIGDAVVLTRGQASGSDAEVPGPGPVGQRSTDPAGGGARRFGRPRGNVPISWCLRHVPPAFRTDVSCPIVRRTPHRGKQRKPRSHPAPTSPLPSTAIELRGCSAWGPTGSRGTARRRLLHRDSPRELVRPLWIPISE